MLTRREWLAASTAVTLRAAKPQDLLDRWREIVRSTDGTVGACALWLDSGRVVSLNGGERFPLASVCKLPLAMNIFALVEEGRLKLNQQVEVAQADVWPGVSDIADIWPKQKSWPVDEMVRLMVARSDNTAEEILYRLGGGAPAMAARFRQWNIAGMRIDRSEKECGRDSTGPTPHATLRAMREFLEDPRDTGTPDATVQLLARLFHGELLNSASTTRMIQILQATTSFPKRLKGLLPAVPSSRTRPVRAGRNISRRLPMTAA